MPSRPCWHAGFPPLGRLSDAVTEADELYQNAGEKGHKHTDPADPPRQRANKARGHGTYEIHRHPFEIMCPLEHGAGLIQEALTHAAEGA